MHNAKQLLYTMNVWSCVDPGDTNVPFALD